jgi:NAD(P)-dependent dehydrogenase (short-subunit alcohol dehydrogenase family)
MALAAEVMKKNPGGSIINISSMASQHPRPYLGAYAASKAGLNTMTKASALEYAPFSIRVNAVICGMFNTSALTDASASDNMKAFSKDIPLGRVAAPDEIIGTIHYLASSMSSYTTGSLIEVTGGTGL